MIRKLILVVLVSYATACTNHTAHPASNKEAKGRDTSFIPSQQRVDFTHIDSVEFIYYPDPLNQKQYQHRFIKDSFVRASLMDLLNKPAGDAAPCTHNSKFYLFRNGAVYKTIYVSDSCSYLAYAVNSRQFFVPMEEPLKRIIDSLEKTMP